ncbi:MAG TPA: hypothetical protein VI757_02230 [Bacteroidia bacterium]|nr:hypothetical protein [Bacteroidia bacterium]
MKKILQTILAIVLVSFLAGEASAQSQQNNSQPTVTYELIKDTPAAADKPAAAVSDNPDIAKPVVNEPQSIWAPEHPGNKTKEEAEKAAEENKKKESEPKK